LSHRYALRAAALLALGMACASCSGSGSSSTTAPTTSSSTPTIVSVAVTGATALTSPGDSAQLKAFATLSDGTSQVVTNSATWSSSSAGVATVNGSGIVKAVASGTATITATATGGKSGTITVTVTTTGTTTTLFDGSAAASGSTGGRVTFTIPAAPNPGTSRASGTLHLLGASSLLGTFDSATHVVNVAGEGYTLIGTISNGVLSGTFTDPAGNPGGFSSLDSTHVAVTVYCGTYTGGSDSGAWNLQVSANGSASGASLTADGSSAPVLLTGRGSDAAITLTGSRGMTATGTISGSTATGTFQGSGGIGGTFTASASGCR
jgi:hypothetical protein